MSGDKDKIFKIRGVVAETLPGTKFKIEIDLKGQKHVLIGHISGRMRMNYIKLQKGDQVDVEVSPYDLTKGRITYRY